MADQTKARGLGRGLGRARGRVPGRRRHGVGRDRARSDPAERAPAAQHVRRRARSTGSSSRSEPTACVQPIVVRDTGDGYEIIAGERRWRAAPPGRPRRRSRRSCARPTSARRSILALAENVAREDLNAVELARAYAVLADELDLTQTEIARRVGRSRPAVANTMRLLELPDDVLGADRGRRAVARATAARSCSQRPGRAPRPGPPGGPARVVGARHRGSGARHGPQDAKPRAGRARWTRSSPTWPSTRRGSRSTCGLPSARGRAGAGSRSTSRAPPSSAGSSTSFAAPNGSVSAGRQLGG